MPLDNQCILSFIQKHINDKSMLNKNELIHFLEENEEEILFKILEMWDSKVPKSKEAINYHKLFFAVNANFYSKN